MKRQIVLVCFFAIVRLHAQKAIELPKTPFDMEVLQEMSFIKDKIMPRFINGKFYYINPKTGKKMFAKGFDVAYPFGGSKSTIVKVKGKFGIINKKGLYLVRPKYLSFQFWRTPFGVTKVSFENEPTKFDLNDGKFSNASDGYAEPSYDPPVLTFFKSDNNKFGIRNFSAGDTKPKTVTEPIFDSVYLIRQHYFIVKQNNKIGIADDLNHTILPFVYDAIVIQKPLESETIPRNVGFENNGIWEYYNVEGIPSLIVKSVHKCQRLGNLIISNALGLYLENEKYHVLFKDGSTTNVGYDWVSANGTIACDGDKIYIIAEDGLPFLYY